MRYICPAPKYIYYTNAFSNMLYRVDKLDQKIEMYAGNNRWDKSYFDTVEFCFDPIDEREAQKRIESKEF